MAAGGRRMSPSPATLLLLFFVFLSSSFMEAKYRVHDRRGGRGKRSFLLERPEKVMRTDAGEVTVARGFAFKGRRPSSAVMHIGFITLEPNALLLPQYVDANLVLFIKKGQVRVGSIHKDDELVEKDLNKGDVYRILSGNVFYLANYGREQRLHVICSIDTSENPGPFPFQSFFIGGGSYPPSVLSGFGMETLTTAFNVTDEELDPIMGRQTEGPIIYMNQGDHGIDLPKKLASMAWRLRCGVFENSSGEDDGAGKGKSRSTWTWSGFVDAVVGKVKVDQKIGRENTAPDSYNLYDRKPDFQNTYGWSVAVGEDDYGPLKQAGIGIYLVNLTAGSMLAPHVNPTATEYGVVLAGSGNIQVAFPNGSSAMNVDVYEGDAFWVPRYFPFCQTASERGAFVFFGFTTSSRRNMPQFLAGASSVPRKMVGPELAAALDVGEAVLTELLTAQKESIILPSWIQGKQENLK